MTISRKYFHLVVILLCAFILVPQNTISGKKPWSVRIIELVMAHNPDTIMYMGVEKSKRWDYERGVVLQGVYQVYKATGNKKYLSYIKKNIDQFIGEDGSIRTYEYASFNIDNIPTGRMLLALYKITNENKYKIAADTLRKQLANQPRTNEGGFWHKKIYPYQMWLDGLYMGEPFYAEYAKMFNAPQDFDDIANQFIWMEKNACDPKTGLLYHAWDESRKMPWANPQTGTSPNFWGRAMGWYIWGLVDALDYFPAKHPKRIALIKILQRLSEALLKFQEPKSGLWYQVVDQGNRKGNYLEASVSCMVTYAYAKGANKGYLDKSYLKVAKKSFQGILDSLVTIDEKGLVNLNNVCSVAGLGGNPYRDGSYEYYIGEKKRTNDLKGVGPFILAALELKR